MLVKCTGIYLLEIKKTSIFFLNYTKVLAKKGKIL